MEIATIVIVEAILIIVVVGFAAIMFAGRGTALTLSAQDIAGYAQNAGFSGSDLVMAVAVALAESSGVSAAIGDLQITPGGSVGLWQINLKYHPEFAGQDLTDPQTNANAAYSVYQAAGDRFTPWSTYPDAASTHIAAATDGVNAMLAATGQTTTDQES